METRTRSTIWDSKELASSSLHCFLKGLQIQVYLFQAHNRVVWRGDRRLLPTLFGQTEPLSSDLRRLVTLTPAQGGLGVPDLRFKAPQQFAASTLIIALHVDSITTQSMSMVPGENFTEELKRQHQALKTASVRSRMESIDSTLPSDLLRSVNQSRDKGASSWLTAVPLVDQGLVLNKQEFRDSLRLRYNMPLSDLPSKCVCGEKYTVCHALSCKKGGVVAQRHDGVRNLLTLLIGKVCTNVEVEPQLQPIEIKCLFFKSKGIVNTAFTE